jgi:protocatechuate 3,4-dioxygenase beta subunit
MLSIGLKNITISLIIVSTFLCIAGLSLAGARGICLPTMNDVEGPYYLPGAPFRNQIANPDEKGRRINIKGTIYHSNCRTPVMNALIEVWQTDAEGRYYYADEQYRLRGQIKSDEYGKYQFSTVKPGRYRILSGFRPAHIHLKVSHPDYRTVITQLYFEGDPYLWPNDACGGGCKSNDPERIIELIDNAGMVSAAFNVILRPLSQ